jgi:methylmalonyl-CoA mutase N-terminal domain/subunit
MCLARHFQKKDLTLPQSISAMAEGQLQSSSVHLCTPARAAVTYPTTLSMKVSRKTQQLIARSWNGDW